MDGTMAPGETIKRVGEASGEAIGAKKYGDAMKGETGAPVPKFAGPKFLGGTGEALKLGNVVKETVKTGENIGEFFSDEGEGGNEEKDEGGEVDNGEMGDIEQEINVILADEVSRNGLGLTMKKFYECDVSSSNDPIGDLKRQISQGTIYEGEQGVKSEASLDINKDVEKERAVIKEMQNLIRGIMDSGADSKWGKLMMESQLAGLNFFDYVAKAYGVGSIPELFQVFREQQGQFGEAEETKVEQEEQEDEMEQGGDLPESVNENRNQWEKVRQDVKGERLNPEITRGNAA